MRKMTKIAALVCALSVLFNITLSALAADQNAEETLLPRTLLECHTLLAQTDQQSETEDVAPCALIHCESGSEVGRYIERLVSSKKIGYETADCSHSIQGRYHIRYQYLDSYEAYCTLCDYSSEFSELRWGDWNCVS